MLQLTSGLLVYMCDEVYQNSKLVYPRYKKYKKVDAVSYIFLQVCCLEPSIVTVCLLVIRVSLFGTFLLRRSRAQTRRGIEEFEWCTVERMYGLTGTVA